MFKTHLRPNGLCKGLLLLAMLAGIVFPYGGAVRTARAEGEANDLTAECSFVLPEKTAPYESRLTDDRYDSRLSFTFKDTMLLTVPKNAKGLYIAWYTAPEAALLEYLDATDEVLSSEAASPDLLNAFYVLPDGCASVRITGARAFAISELTVYDSATAPESLCLLGAQGAHPAVMLVAAHTGDEDYYFGSLLPFLRSGNVAVVFMMSYSRTAQQEAMEQLCALGCRTQPVFAGFTYYRSYMDSKGMYGLVDKKEITAYFLALLRRYQPDVIVTHDIAGEDGDCTHVLAATQVQLAAEQAADETKYSPSTADYGVWQVKAVYQHREAGSVKLYDTTLPLAAFGGKSALELAQEGFDQYGFLKVYRASVLDTPYFMQTYPEDASVSQEQSTQDLLALLSAAAPEDPLAAATPTPTAAPETPSPAPTATPAPESAPQATMAFSFGSLELDQLSLPAGIGLGALGLGLILLAFTALKKAKSPASRVLLLLAAALLLLAGAALVYRSIKAAQAPEATPSPTAAPDTPAPTGTPEPTPTPDPMAEHFRKADDPAEVVEFDYENGNYVYRNDSLAIEIHRVTHTDPPVVYFVAHIYMRNYDSYRSGFGSERQNGRDPVDACTMARRYRAVFGLTGDNLLHSGYDRGLLIRDGRIYRALSAESVMVLTDDLSMRIYEKGDPASLAEIDDGAYATYAFGPPLLLNGQLCPDVDQDRVGRINPRAGLGLVEPGHFVAIVVDGRIAGYSHGILLSEFATMFQDEGCVMAYNLDGGASATMVFMGEYINLRSVKHYRTVPDQLLWGYSDLVPSEDEPRLYSGLVGTKDE